MIVLEQPATFFRLPELDALPRSLASLPSIDPRFSLPDLDEFASGSERLLAGLQWDIDRRRKGPSSPSSPSPSAKGKEREVSDEVVPKPEDEVVRPRGLDIWQQIAGSPEAGPSRTPTFRPLRTWDTLDPSSPPQQDGSKEGAHLLSEAPVFAFEALIAITEGPLQLPKLKGASVAPPPKDSKELLDLMMRASLGATTTDALRWDKQGAKYLWNEERGRPVGLDRQGTASQFGDFLRIGTAIRRLEILVDALSPTPLTSTHHSLLHAVSTYLALMKQRLSSATADCTRDSTAAWQKWSLAVQECRDLSAMLCELMYWPLDRPKASSLPNRGSAILSHIHAHLLSYLALSPFPNTPQILALAYILSLASRPFLGLLHQWIGLADSPPDDGDLASQPWADLGITRTPAHGHTVAGDLRWEYEFASKRMPGFVPKELRRTLFEAGRSLRLLREASGGQHPLCAGKWGIEAEWQWGEDDEDGNTLHHHTRRVQHEIEHWRRSVRERSKPLSSASSFGQLRRSAKKERKRLPSEFMQPPEPHVSQSTLQDTRPSIPTEIDALWALFAQAPGSHLGARPDQASTTPLWAPTPLSELEAFLTRHSPASTLPLLPPSCPTLSLYISTRILSPLVAHAELVSTSLVSLYLDDLHFAQHLDVLFAYWLGGDAGFAERVAGALFGKDEAGAGEALGMGKRARTRARLGLTGGFAEGSKGVEQAGAEWGIGLGLGLSERQRWPPGGAELAYALRTTLLDEEEDSARLERGAVWEGVEDRVSFAVRALPEESAEGKRAKWMDPQAIEALDFLYLSYSPDPSIAVLLPAALLDKYQKIYNLLLRLARVQTVLRSLYLDATHQSNMLDQPVKVGVDMPWRPSSTARTSRAVFEKDTTADKVLQGLRFRMSMFVSAVMRYILDRAVSANWQVMRRRIERLKRRAAPGKEPSRPSTPMSEVAEDDNLSLADDHSLDDGEDLGQVKPLRSIHSLVTYHHLTLDRILRACLLGPSTSQQVAHKVLMRMFGLVLNLGKVVKEVVKGVREKEVAARRVREIEADWKDKEAVFLRVLERLAARSSRDRREGDLRPTEEDRDLEMLMSGEGGRDDAHAAIDRVAGDGGGDLADLLLRLQLGSQST